MATKQFSHSGTILAVEQDFVRVGFETKGACGGCAARAKCGMVDASSREVEIPTYGGDVYQVGQEVNIAISYQMGVVSVVFAYIVPLILLITVLASASALRISDGVAALASLIGVGLYYVGVYIFRNKLEKQIKFTIEKK